MQTTAGPSSHDEERIRTADCAYELGAARRLYAGGFRPDVISGVSIGAITAVLLGRSRSGDPIATLNSFWQRVSLPGWLAVFDPLHLASVFGVPNFYTPRLDVLQLASWTNIYTVGQLRATLEELVDLERLGRTNASPQLIVSATNLESGTIDYFDSRKIPLTLDHVLASGALPPSFPMVRLRSPDDGSVCSYWDGGVFDNTPLGPVIEAVGLLEAAAPEIVVVNLFQNRAVVPGNMLDVSNRFLNLIFANKTRGDLALMKRFNDLVTLADALPDDLKNNVALRPLLEELDTYKYIPVLAITPEKGALDAARSGGSSDFSAEGIELRAKLGWEQADRSLAGRWPVSGS